jgi:lipopolysaccharide/colanic/teichoic acid biosynthesis glycosyltransferase
MSFVGPRPLLVRYLPYYTDEEKRRHEVRPGLTGLAQINGRNMVGWEERLRLDVRYVDNLSFRSDLIILFGTINKVIFRKDIGIPGVDTPGYFDEYRKLVK